MANFNELLEEYSTMAAFIDDKEEELKQIKKVRDKIKEALMVAMQDPALNISSAKSSAGHQVVLVKSNSATVTDAEAFFDFVFERGDADFLTKRVAIEAVEEYVSVNNQLPPGVEMKSAMTLRFTKAKG